jgi:gliding motility-associatede transport system auxiliary component
MNRTLRAILAVVFVLVIMFSAISISQNIKRPLRVDVTEEKLYTLSTGTEDILNKIAQDQPITIKFYYSREAALNAPDWIKAYHTHYLYVRALLQEYAKQAAGKIQLQEIDPRQFSQEEVDARADGVNLYPLGSPEEEDEVENFAFGMVVQTQFDAKETIPFFPPERKHLVEYEISRAIDKAILQNKKKIGILSSLPVIEGSMMVQVPNPMTRQPQPQRVPFPDWFLVRHLRQMYEVKKVSETTKKIDSDLDILLVIHPQGLSSETLQAIDQFVLTPEKRALVFLDPHAEVEYFKDYMEHRVRLMAQRMPYPIPFMPQATKDTSSQLSDPNNLLDAWGLEMPEHTYVVDFALKGLGAWWREMWDKEKQQNSRLPAAMKPDADINYRPLGFLRLQYEECFSTGSAASAGLSDFRMFFPGVLREKADHDPALKLTPLLLTTGAGNILKPNLEEKVAQKDVATMVCTHCSKKIKKDMKYYRDVVDEINFCSRHCGIEYYKLAFKEAVRDPQKWPELKRNYVEGVEALCMAYLVTGKLQTAFPKGLETSEEKKGVMPRRETDDGAIIVVADVDCISDICMAKPFRGNQQILTQNTDFLDNAIELLSGSDELIKVRTRGRPRRFVKIDEIEREAREKEEKDVAAIEDKAAEQEAAIVEEIGKLQVQLEKSEGDVKYFLDMRKGKFTREASAAYQQTEAELMQKIVELNRQKESIQNETERQTREIKKRRRETIEAAGMRIKTVNLILAPSIILVIAVALGIYRNLKRRYYISHASDA